MAPTTLHYVQLLRPGKILAGDRLFLTSFAMI